IEVIKAIRGITDQRLFVDANQGWTDVEEAIDTAAELVELGVGLIEQPFAKGEPENAGRLRDRCGVPVIADEDVQTAGDIAQLSRYYDGINIKLMKAGGIREAHKMIREARELGLKVLLGCMTESSIGISAAAQLAQYADWCDLDGNLLITNDTCNGVATVNGELRLSDAPGIGITGEGNLSSLFGPGG
ncbi:MAG: dipeptide epimerase, partial [Acidobacteriota bacterium]|nr:dipeptide epimerase [Acidobacteriota bacterium]